MVIVVENCNKIRVIVISIPKSGPWLITDIYLTNLYFHSPVPDYSVLHVIFFGCILRSIPQFVALPGQCQRITSSPKNRIIQN